METLSPKRSIVGLVRTLKVEVQKLFRQELELVKAELSEKLSVFGRNAAALVAGGVLAYAGLIVFLIGIGWLIAWALEHAGLDPALAGFVGLAVTGLAGLGVGMGLVLKGIKTMSKESLAPQKTVHTIQRLRPSAPKPELAEPEVPAPKHSSQEMQSRVERTEDRVADTLEELGQRLSPAQFHAQVKHRIREKPYRSGLVAMAAGVLSGLVLTRPSRHSS